MSKEEMGMLQWIYYLRPDNLPPDYVVLEFPKNILFIYDNTGSADKGDSNISENLDISCSLHCVIFSRSMM